MKKLIIFSVLLGAFIILELFFEGLPPTQQATLLPVVGTYAKEPSPSPDAPPVDNKPRANIPQYTGYQLKVPILMYHYIGNNPDPADLARDSLSVAPDKFDEQMEYLATHGYSPISLDTMYAALQKQVSLPAKPVVLTFDDGYVDFYVNAYNILRKYNFHATVFIPTALMGQGYYLSWDQIREMSASGLITFGAHTVNHANLPSISPDKVVYELTESKKVLQDQLGIPINFFSYPNGATNAAVIELTKKAGYVGAVGTWPGKTQSVNTIFHAPRIRIGGYTDLPAFISLL